MATFVPASRARLRPVRGLCTVSVSEAGPLTRSEMRTSARVAERITEAVAVAGGPTVTSGVGAGGSIWSRPIELPV